MITVTPQGNIYLCKTPLENDYNNQLTFDDLEDQLTYFNSKIVKTFDNYTYMKKDSIIKVGVNIDEIIDCNYLFYRNNGFTNKYYFCFITSKEYINENVTALSIETDVFQTWQFDIEYHKTFIEREHVNSDGYGEHTVPETLETGEYMYDYVQNFDTGTSHLVMATTVSPITLKGVRGGTYGGIVSGVSYYVFQNATTLYSAINRMAGGDNIFTGGKLDGIHSIFYLPDFITGVTVTTNWGEYGVKEIEQTGEASIGTGIAIPLNPTKIDGYTCKNRKCFIYPYVAYTLSNNQGGSMVYRLEDFLDTGSHTGGIDIKGACTPGGSIRAIPINYKITTNSLDYDLDHNVKDKINDYGLTLGKFPICSWSGDVYTNWLTQNAVSMGYNMAMDFVNSPIAAPTYAEDVITNRGIMNSLISVYEHSLVPYQAQGNVNSGDVTFSDGLMTYTGYMSTITAEYAKIIDDYFSAYGYKVNAYKTPNVTGRRNWNYVKTIGCNIDGDIPQEDLNILKGMFNKGVTFWHNPANMYNYDANNDII